MYTHTYIHTYIHTYSTRGPILMFTRLICIYIYICTCYINIHTCMCKKMNIPLDASYGPSPIH